jgi:hypothetical protein
MSERSHYETVSLQNVMQFFADSFKGDAVRKNVDGSVAADWWIDPVKGEVVFRLILSDRAGGQP